jgi:hypothetical protein
VRRNAWPFLLTSRCVEEKQRRWPFEQFTATMEYGGGHEWKRRDPPATLVKAVAWMAEKQTQTLEIREVLMLFPFFKPSLQCPSLTTFSRESQESSKPPVHHCCLSTCTWMVWVNGRFREPNGTGISHAKSTTKDHRLN